MISRFKEREENVKADIFHAYVALLKQTKTAILPQLGMLLNKMSLITIFWSQAIKSEI